jgi:hypothetical protein
VTLSIQVCIPNQISIIGSNSMLSLKTNALFVTGLIQSNNKLTVTHNSPKHEFESESQTMNNLTL